MNVMEARGKKIYKSGKVRKAVPGRKQVKKNSRSLKVRGSSRVFLI